MTARLGINGQHKLDSVVDFFKKRQYETGVGLEVAVDLGGVGGVEMMCSKYVI